MLGNEVHPRGVAKGKLSGGAWQLESKIPEPVCVCVVDTEF